MSVQKFKKQIKKKDFDVGFSTVTEWINTGNASLNEIISGDMRKGIPSNRSTIFQGLQGTGKSFLLCNAAKNAQQEGYFVIYIDTENALGEGFAEKIGVDMGEDYFFPVNMTTIEETTSFSSEMFKNFERDDKVCIILDSLSNLDPERDQKKFDEAKIAYGQGLREKQLKQLVKNINSRVGTRNMLFITSSHMYVNGSDVYGNPILKPNVGEGTLFLPSVVVQLNKKPLREGKHIEGISIKAKTLKTRFTKLGKSCQFDLPWDRGMDFLDGALDVLEQSGIVEKNAAWYSYLDANGETKKFQRSSFDKHADYLMELYSSDSDAEKDDAETNEEMVSGIADTKETKQQETVL